MTELVLNMTDKEEHRLSFKQKILNAVHSRYGMWLLAFMAFLESAFFPIPPDFVIVPMVIARPDSWKRVALWVSIASVLGSFLGYYIGFALFEQFGQMVIDKYGLADQMVQIGESFKNNAFWSLFVAAFSPLPFKLFTIAAGVFKVSLIPFTLAAVVGRTARYILVPYLSALGGRSMSGSAYIKKMTRWMWLGLLVGGIIFVVIKYPI